MLAKPMNKTATSPTLNKEAARKPVKLLLLLNLMIGLGLVLGS